jgi:KaiC/GvpD/RAD55 family RecA-like ATPase/DNA-binding response OmpR family regulator
MNGSTEVRSSSKTSVPGPEVGGARTDTPLPIAPAVTEVPAGRTARNADRLISGIDLVDYGVGGLLPNKVYVVKGGVGVGKTILGLQYLTRGLEHQEPGILITDQKPESVVAQAKSIGFPIEEAIKRNQLSILNPSGQYFDLVESPADVQAIVEELGDYVKRIGAKRLVIDPIYTLINTSYSAHFALMVTQSLMNALEELPTTTLLVAGDEDNAELNPIVRMVEQNAFGVIALSQDKPTGGRIMSLSKLRYASNDNLTAHYRILNGRGLINYRGEGEQVSDVTQAWDETTTSKRTVLLIGAQPDTIKRVKESLGDGYQVSAESDPKAGVERARNDKFSLVLVTPSRSTSAISAILDLAQNSSSSIAFLSPAGNRQSDKVLYLRAGADDFITEPFSSAELKARVDALVRRSGRRLNTRDTGIGSISADELSSLMNTDEPTTSTRNRAMLTAKGNDVAFEPEFKERLDRNIATVSKFDSPFAMYWIKAKAEDPKLSQSLAQLCRQEDILCHNRNGEFVAILTGTDQNGVKGFENRLNEKLGSQIGTDRVTRGYKLYKPGEANA